MPAPVSGHWGDGGQWPSLLTATTECIHMLLGACQCLRRSREPFGSLQGLCAAWVLRDPLCLSPTLPHPLASSSLSYSGACSVLRLFSTEPSRYGTGIVEIQRSLNTPSLIFVKELMRNTYQLFLPQVILSQ